MANRDLSQGKRAVLLLLEIGLLLVACYFGFGRLFPPLADTGLWFYAALLSLLLANRLVTPFYVKPADAIAYSIAGLVTVILATHWDRWEFYEKLVYLFAVSYAAAVALSAFLAILFKDAVQGRVIAVGNALRLAAATLGSPRALFSVIMFFAAYVFHRENANELLWIGIAWGTTVAFSPLEAVAQLARKVGDLGSAKRRLSIIGNVAAYQTPNVILIHQDTVGEIRSGTAILIRDQHLGMKTARRLTMWDVINGCCFGQ